MELSTSTFNFSYRINGQYTTQRTCPRIALGNWGGTVTPIIYLANSQLVLILQGGQHNCLHRLYSRSTAFLPQSPALLALACQIVRVSSCPLLSATYWFPNLRPSTVLLIFCSLVAFGLCLSPATTLGTCFVRRPQRAVLSSSPDASGGCPPGQVCTVRSCITCLGARCLGSHWGLEVPGNPVLGSLHSPSTWRKVSLGGSRFQGCHGYLPFGLWLLLPANLLGTSSQAHLFVMSLNVAKYNLG